VQSINLWFAIPLLELNSTIFALRKQPQKHYPSPSRILAVENGAALNLIFSTPPLYRIFQHFLGAEKANSRLAPL